MGNSICYRGRSDASDADVGHPVGPPVVAPAPAMTAAPRVSAVNDLNRKPISNATMVTKDLQVSPSPKQAQTQLSESLSPAPAGERHSHHTMVTTDNTITSTITASTITFEPPVVLCSIIVQSPEEILDDIQILSPLGAGAFAVVYRGIYKGTDVAIKLTSVDPDATGWSEANVASQLRHPNVVQTHTARATKVTQEFYDRVRGGARSGTIAPVGSSRPQLAAPDLNTLGVPGDCVGRNPSSSERPGWGDALFRVGASPNRGLLVLVQEFCNKGSLVRAIHNGLFSLTGKSLRGQLLVRRTLLRTAAEICRGMCYLHNSSIIHGDLKPANVLLVASNLDCRGFAAKIADFGLARMLHGDTDRVESASTGTVTYMSPEALRGVHSRESDVYAFGMLLWEMLTGQRPYARIPVGQVLLGVSFRGLRPPWPDDQWPELCALGRSCLAQEPKDRPSFKELEERLVELEEAVREEIRRHFPKAKREGSRNPSQLPSGHQARPGSTARTLSGAASSGAAAFEAAAEAAAVSGSSRQCAAQGALRCGVAGCSGSVSVGMLPAARNAAALSISSPLPDQCPVAMAASAGGLGSREAPGAGYQMSKACTVVASLGAEEPPRLTPGKAVADDPLRSSSSAAGMLIFGRRR